ncbi:MAG: metallophosphoesterase, partial [Polyangiaceae bacterium]
TVGGSLLVLAVAVACSKTEPPAAPESSARSKSSSPAAALSAPPPSAPPAVEDTSFRFANAERIIAIGDIHGDVQAARAALRLGGAIDGGGKWVGGTLVVVQTGDQLDRGDDEPQILDLFERLRAEAKAVGGALYALNGNHEIINAQGDFRYVTADGFHDFSDRHPNALLAPLLDRLPEQNRGRAVAFLPGGDIAKRLSQQPVVIQIGDNVFVHGGVLEAHVRYGLGRINREAREWLTGAPSAPAPRVLTDPEAPIWVRDYSDGTPASAKCAELERVLAALSAKRLVVGHTIQKQGINSACADKVWRIDVGLSKFYGAKPSVLEIRGDQVRVLSVE